MALKKFPTNKIMRVEYTRSGSVKNKGPPSKNIESLKNLPKLKHGLMSEHGYHLNENATKRQSAIQKSIIFEGFLPVYKRLVVLKLYHKNKQGLIFNRLSNDIKYSKEFFEKNKLKGGSPKKKIVKNKLLKIKSILKKRKSTVKKIKKSVRFRK